MLAENSESSVATAIAGPWRRHQTAWLSSAAVMLGLNWIAAASHAQDVVEHSTPPTTTEVERGAPRESDAPTEASEEAATSSVRPRFSRREPLTPDQPVVFELDNGLTVAFQRDPRWSTAGICVAYRVGSGDDPVGYRGLAHLTEHLMFSGSPRAEDGFHAALEPLGARHINAYTSRDRTVYQTEVPTHALPRALFYEADRMGYLLETLDEERLAVQRRVVLHEYHERGGDSPGANVELARVEALYPPDSGYRRIYEKTGDIEAISLDNVRWFFQQRYGPKNAVLAIVANETEANVRAMVQRYFGHLRGATPPPARSEEIPPLERSRNIIVDTVFSTETISFSWLTPAWFAEGDAELDLAARWISDQLSEELDNPSYRSSSVRQSSQPGHGEFVVRIGAEEDIDASTFAPIVERVIQTLHDELLSEADFGRIRDAQTIASRIGHDRPLQRAEHLAKTGANGEVRSAEVNVARFADVTRESLREAVRRWLPLDRRVRILRNRFGYASRAGNIRLLESD